MTHTEKRILAVLSRHEDWEWDYGNCWRKDGTRYLAAAIRRSVAETKRALRSLVEAGLLEYTIAWDEDGFLKGSGYFITPMFYKTFGGGPYATH